MTDIDDLDRPCWGAGGIARILNVSERRAFHLLAQGRLPARKVGGRWCSTPRRLLEFITGNETQTAKGIE
jgi:hypothetical protein